MRCPKYWFKKGGDYTDHIAENRYIPITGRELQANIITG
jgi:hypothetical protein